MVVSGDPVNRLAGLEARSPLFTELPRRVIPGNSRLKNSAFASCAGPLKPVGSVAVTGLVDAVGRG